MTDRELMQQALEALQSSVPTHDGFLNHCKAMNHIRIRLAQPEQEPFAYSYLGIKANGEQHGPHLTWKPEYMDAMSASMGAVAVPLYTAPPQRKPLTDEEIEDIWADCPVDWDDKINVLTLARAIEAAHGIEENT